MLQCTELHQCNPLHKQSQTQKPLIISLDAEKAFDKIQHHFMLKSLERTGIQGPYLKHHKSNIQQTGSQHQTKWREIEAIPLKSGTRQGCTPLHILSI